MDHLRRRRSYAAALALTPLALSPVALSPLALSPLALNPWRRYAAAFRITSDGTLTNTANGLQLALHTPSKRLTFVPRVNAGSEGTNVCPTRQLVLDTPTHVRSQLWELRDGCKSIIEINNCWGENCDRIRGTTEGCRLHKCGYLMPCCVKYMPSRGGGGMYAADFSVYWANVGKDYKVQWSMNALMSTGLLTTDSMSHGARPTT